MIDIKIDITTIYHILIYSGSVLILTPLMTKGIEWLLIAYTWIANIFGKRLGTNAISAMAFSNMTFIRVRMAGLMITVIGIGFFANLWIETLQAFQHQWNPGNFGDPLEFLIGFVSAFLAGIPYFIKWRD